MMFKVHMYKQLKQALALAVVGVICSVFAVSSVFAGQGFYGTDNSIKPGMLVSLTKNPGVIEPANNNNAGELVGVVGSSQNDLSIQQGQIAVQTEGLVQALVSTASGDIKVGDKISPSILNGVGAKVGQNGVVVGISQGSLSSDTKDAIKTSITDANNVAREVYVASIPVLVKVTYISSNQQVIQDKGSVLQILQDIAEAVAGKRVSTSAVILSFILLLVGIFISGIIINTVIRNGFQAIGRQPLSKKDIIRNMLRSVIFAISLLLFSVVGALVVIKSF